MFRVCVLILISLKKVNFLCLRFIFFYFIIYFSKLYLIKYLIILLKIINYDMIVPMPIPIKNNAHVS